MRKEEFYFDSRDGETKIYAVRFTPDTDNVKGVVQIVHGMSEYINCYEEFAKFLTDKGFVVTGEDHLGHGKTLIEGSVPGYFCENDPATVAVRDVHRLKKKTQELYPTVPYILFGHSMGSFIVRNYMCRYGKGISAAIIEGTGMQSQVSLKFGKLLVAVQEKIYGPKHVSMFINRLVFGNYAKRCKPQREFMDWQTKDTAYIDKYVKDPLCGFPFPINGFETLFELISRLYVKENLENVPKTLPVLIMSGTEDPVGEYGKGVKKTYDSLKNVGLENLQLKMYDNDRHALLNETDKEAVMQDIYDWIKVSVLS